MTSDFTGTGGSEVYPIRAQTIVSFTSCTQSDRRIQRQVFSNVNGFRPYENRKPTPFFTPHTYRRSSIRVSNGQTNRTSERALPLFQYPIRRQELIFPLSYPSAGAKKRCGAGSVMEIRV